MATSIRSSSNISSQLDNQGSRFGVVCLDALINRRPQGYNLALRAVKGLAVQQRVDLGGEPARAVGQGGKIAHKR
jgi:hypothetical protein